jgi:GMP synthase-like glutamine amidotransferase
LSNLISNCTRQQVAAESGAVAATLTELGQRAADRGLPTEFASACMSAMQEVAMDLISKQPEQRVELAHQAFEAFWRAVE